MPILWSIHAQRQAARIPSDRMSKPRSQKDGSSRKGSATEMRIQDTEVIGKYQHVIRLSYPCGNLEDLSSPRGYPPTLQMIAVAAKRHREECEICEKCICDFRPDDETHREDCELS